MLEEVKAGYGEKEGRNEWPEGKTGEIQAGQTTELPGRGQAGAASHRGGFPWDRCFCRAQHPHASCLTMLNGEAKLDNLWHQVGGGGGGGQEWGYGGIMAEMLGAGPEWGVQGALVNKLAATLLPNMSRRKTNAWADRRS